MSTKRTAILVRISFNLLLFIFVCAMGFGGFKTEISKQTNNTQHSTMAPQLPRLLLLLRPVNHFRNFTTTAATVTQRTLQWRHRSSRIIVAGVGTAGCNALNTLIQNANHGGFGSAVPRPKLVAINDDSAHLNELPAECDHKVLLSSRSKIDTDAALDTPDRGADLAEDNKHEIWSAILDDGDSGTDGADLLVVCGGVGGALATGAIPVIAQQARERNLATVATVFCPFLFEGEGRLRIAHDGVRFMEDTCDAVVTIDNDNQPGRMCTGDDEEEIADGFKQAEDQFYHCLRALSVVVDANQLKPVLAGGPLFLATEWGILDVQMLGGSDPAEQAKCDPLGELLKRAMDQVKDRVSHPAQADRVVAVVTTSGKGHDGISLDSLEQSLRKEFPNVKHLATGIIEADERLVEGAVLTLLLGGDTALGELYPFDSVLTRLSNRKKNMRSWEESMLFEDELQPEEHDHGEEAMMGDTPFPRKMKFE